MPPHSDVIPNTGEARVRNLLRAQSFSCSSMLFFNRQSKIVNREIPHLTSPLAPAYHSLATQGFL